MNGAIGLIIFIFFVFAVFYHNKIRDDMPGSYLYVNPEMKDEERIIQIVYDGKLQIMGILPGLLGPISQNINVPFLAPSKILETSDEGAVYLMPKNTNSIYIKTNKKKYQYDKII